MAANNTPRDTDTQAAKPAVRRQRIARFGTPEAEGLDPRHVIGKPHADRARQFVPFMALKGYFDLVEDAKQMEGAETLIRERFEE